MTQNELQQENASYQQRMLSSSNNISTNINFQQSQTIKHSEKVLLKKWKKIQKRKQKKRKKQKISIISCNDKSQQQGERKQGQQEEVSNNDCDNWNVDLVQMIEGDNNKNKQQVQNDKVNQVIIPHQTVIINNTETTSAEKTIIINSVVTISAENNDSSQEQQEICMGQMQIERKQPIKQGDDDNNKSKQLLQVATNNNNNKNNINNSYVVNENVNENVNDTSTSSTTKLEDIGFVVYQEQFNTIYQQLNSFIQQTINNHHITKTSNHKITNLNKNIIMIPNLNKNIIMVGQPQSGKKHLFNQCLIKLYCQWNNNNKQKELQNDKKQNNITLSIIKRFINEQNIYLLGNSQEKQNPHQQHQQHNYQDQQQLPQSVQSVPSPQTNSKLNILMRVNFINNIINQTTNEYSQLYKRINQQHHINHRQCNLADISTLNLADILTVNVNVFLVTNSQQYSIQQTQQQININDNNQLFVVTLPAFTLLTNCNPLMIKRLQHFFIHSIKQIEQKINSQLKPITHRQQTQQQQRIVCIEYNLSVIVFTTKYIIKKYQQQNNKHTVSHPISVLRYLSNYLYNYYKGVIKTYHIKHTIDNHLNQNQNQPSLKLSSPIISNFLNTLQSSNYDNPIININFTSLILPHQIILIACYMYLTSSQYLNSLYINANKLFKFFIIVQQTLNIQQINQKKYWQLLEKLKDLGLLKFCQNTKSQRLSMNNHNKSKRQTNKNIKFIKDYKNHNFMLNFPLEKIKENLQKMEIYRKFFIEE